MSVHQTDQDPPIGRYLGVSYRPSIGKFRRSTQFVNLLPYSEVSEDMTFDLEMVNQVKAQILICWLVLS